MSELLGLLDLFMQNHPVDVYGAPAASAAVAVISAPLEASDCLRRLHPVRGQLAARGEFTASTRQVGYIHRWARHQIFLSPISDIRHRYCLVRYRRKICRTEVRQSDIGSIR
jgi:hypothetical protein